MSEKPYLIEIRPKAIRLAIHVEHWPTGVSRDNRLTYYDYRMLEEFAEAEEPLDPSVEDENGVKLNMQSTSSVIACKIAIFLHENHNIPLSEGNEIRKGFLRGLWSNAVSAELDKKDRWRLENTNELLEKPLGKRMFPHTSVLPPVIIPEWLVTENSKPHTFADFKHYVFSFKPDSNGKQPAFEWANLGGPGFPPFDVDFIKPKVAVGN